jgi:hypothetical protein
MVSIVLIRRRERGKLLSATANCYQPLHYLLELGQDNAYGYNGAFLMYGDQGFGNHIDSRTAGQYLFEILDECWTQQGQDSDVAESGVYWIWVGSNLVGAVCIPNAENSRNWCASRCPNK